LKSNGKEEVTDKDGNITEQPIILHHPDLV
jgi:hypothetical protein